MTSANRRKQASRLAVAVGVGLAIATGHGVAAADTTDGPSSGAASDPNKNSTAGESKTSEPSGAPGSDTGVDANTPSTTKTDTTSPTDGSDQPPTSTPETGSAMPNAAEIADESNQTTTPAEATSSPSLPAVAAAPTPTVEPVAAIDEPVTPVSTDPSATSTAHLFAAAVATASNVAIPASEPVEADVQPMAMRSMSDPLITADDQTPPALQLPELPEYPTVPGLTDTQVAAVVVVFLAKTLKTALDGGFPLPVTLPIYLVLAAAFVRLEQLATNHVPTATYQQTGQALGIVTGTVTGVDPDGDPLTYSLATGPTKGTALVLPDGTYTYVASNLLGRDGGTDTFTVTVDDSLGILSHPHAPNGHTTTIAVTVDVAGSGINLAPTITSAAYTSYDATTGVVTGAVVATDPENDSLTYSGSALGGSVVFAGDGTFTYTPTALTRHAAALALNPIDTDVITVTVNDGQLLGTSLPALVTVPVAPFNSLPSGTVSVGAPGLLGVVTGGIAFGDGDGDLVTPSPLLIVTTKGSVVVTPLGLFTYTPTTAARHAAAATTATAADKVDTFTVTLSDLYGGTTQVPVTVTISPLNTAPTGLPAVGLPNQIGVIRGTVLGLDLVDLDSLTYTSKPTGAPQYGYVVVSSNGDFVYVPRVSDTFLGLPAPKADSFVVTIDDGHGGLTDVSVGVSAYLGVTATNGAVNPTTGAVTGSFNIPAGDVGLLTFTGGTAPTKGTVTFTGTGYTYTPTAAARHAAAATGAPSSALTDTFSIVGTDGGGHSITVAAVSVTVSPLNSAPTGTATVSTPDANGVVTGTVTASDGDLDILSYSGTSAKGGTVTFNGVDFTYTPTLTARHAAAADGASVATKQDTITINVADGHGAVTPITKIVTITPYNTNPSFTVAKTGLLSLRTITLSGADAESDALTYSVTAAPTKGTLTPGLLGIFTYVPNNVLSPAADSFTVLVNDGHGGTYSQTVVLP